MYPSADIGRGSRAVAILEGSARRLVVLGAVVAPWLFGSAEPWAYFTISLLVFSGAVCWLVSAIAFRRTSLPFPGVSIALLLLLLYVCLQAAPLPPRLAAALSPTAAGLAESGRNDLAAIAGEGAALPANPGGIAVSVSPRSTLSSVYILAMCIVAFLVTVNCARHWHDIGRMAAVIVACGFGMTLLSLVHNFSGVRELLWFHVPRHMEYGFGPFANRNHFAFHLLLLFALAFGLFLASAGFQDALRFFNWRERLLFLATPDANRMCLLGFAAIVFGAAVFVTLSRGAIASLSAAMLLSAGAAAVAGWRRRATVIMAGACLCALAVVWLGWQPVVERLGTLLKAVQDPAHDNRFMASSDTLTLFGLFPLTGCGLGSFQYVFPLVSRPELDFGRWVHAHNDWVEWLAEGGIVGMLLVLFIAFAFVRELRHGIRAARREKRLFAAGCAVGMLAVALHSFADFGVRKPANGLLFAVLAGMTLAAARPPWRRGNVVGRPTGAGDSPPRRARGRRGFARAVRDAVPRLAASVLLALVATAAFMGTRCLSDSLAFKRFEYQERLCARVSAPEQKEAIIATARDDALIATQATSCRPDRLQEILAAYSVWTRDKTLGGPLRDELAEEAAALARQGVEIAPSDFLAWLWLARTELAVGRWDAAQRCIARSMRLKTRGQEPTLLFRNLY